MTRQLPTRLALAALLLPLAAYSAGCATLASAHGSTAKNDEITARITALEGLVTSLSACGERGKAEDNGVVAVSAKPDGHVAVDINQWYGSDEMKGCIAEAAGKATLPPWGGGTLSALWLVGTKEHPAPPAITEHPPNFASRLQNQVAEVMGTDELGPLLTCVQQNLPNDAYAKVDYRLTVFPDGKVAAVSPVAVDGEGRDAGYQDCLRKLVLGWTFEPFKGPGYITGVVTFKKGVDNTYK